MDEYFCQILKSLNVESIGFTEELNTALKGELKRSPRLGPDQLGSGIAVLGTDTWETQIWFGHIKYELPIRHLLDIPRSGPLLPFMSLLYSEPVFQPDHLPSYFRNVH